MTPSSALVLVLFLFFLFLFLLYLGILLLTPLFLLFFLPPSPSSSLQTILPPIPLVTIHNHCLIFPSSLSSLSSVLSSPVTPFITLSISLFSHESGLVPTLHAYHFTKFKVSQKLANLSIRNLILRVVFIQ